MPNAKTDRLAERLSRLIEREIKKSGLDADFVLGLISEGENGAGTYMVEKVVSRHPPKDIYEYLIKFHKDNPLAWGGHLPGRPN